MIFSSEVDRLHALAMKKKKKKKMGWPSSALCGAKRLIQLLIQLLGESLGRKYRGPRGGGDGAGGRRVGGRGAASRAAEPLPRPRAPPPPEASRKLMTGRTGGKSQNGSHKRGAPGEDESVMGHDERHGPSRAGSWSIAGGPHGSSRAQIPMVSRQICRIAATNPSPRQKRG